MTRALVLGGGGVTGIAWSVGVLDRWAASGWDPRACDLVVGTSAGAVVGARLALGADPAALAALTSSLTTLGRLSARALARLAGAQLARDRRAAIVRLVADADRRSSLPEEAWVDRVAAGLVGRPWPRSFAVVAVNGRTGEPRVFTADDGVDLGRAVAASCTVPGVFPPVHLDDDPWLDGGMRSLANADLAAGHERVLALTPITAARDPLRRPGVQLAALPDGTAWLHVWPDRAAVQALGLDVLDAAHVPDAVAAGRRQGDATAAVARRVWAGSPAG